MIADDPDPGVQDAHDRAEKAGLDGYWDPVTRNWVFTATYLANRGTCCGSGCRHCPY